MISENDFWRVALSSSLLFFICFLSLSFNKFDYDIQYSYIWLDSKCHCFRPLTESPYQQSLQWFIKRFTNLLIPIVLVIINIINPDFKKWGFNLWGMWLFYYSVIAISFALSYDRIPFHYLLESTIISIQAVYVVYCGYHTFKR